MSPQASNIRVGSFWVLSRPGFNGGCYKTGYFIQVMNVDPFLRDTVRFNILAGCDHPGGHLSSHGYFLKLFKPAQERAGVLEFLSNLLSEQ